ncbi:SDR family oxidoreductase [Winogradskyella aurantiaca]|uniref:SDR family oxidoreductase n=1 Tax=Winogradskyella aurantiaca TaxID=2219558 RepID=UPI000E1CBBC0|nr:SDR family oxidoreductase [Winogradskyella aurantiaca]
MAFYNNKTIWVTGASSGIGKALAVFLSRYDCKLILSARREEVLNEVRLECNNPERVAVLAFDLKDYNLFPGLVKQATDMFGSVDIMILNGGISQRSALIDTDIEVDKQLMEIDYLSNVALSKALLPHFIQNKYGHFVVVTSLMGKFSSPFRSSYCGAKHALHGFFNALRLEHYRDNVKVTLVGPGFVNTNIARNALTEDGSLQGHQDKKTEQGMSPELFAKKMARAIRKGKFEVYIGGFEKIGVLVSRLSPKLIHTMVKNMQVR